MDMIPLSLEGGEASLLSMFQLGVVIPLCRGFWRRIPAILECACTLKEKYFLLPTGKVFKENTGSLHQNDLKQHNLRENKTDWGRECSLGKPCQSPVSTYSPRQGRHSPVFCLSVFGKCVTLFKYHLKNIFLPVVFYEQGNICFVAPNCMFTTCGNSVEAQFA